MLIIEQSASVRTAETPHDLQISALSVGTLRMTAKEFEAEVMNVRAEISSLIEELDRPMPKDTVLRDIGIDLNE